MSNILYCVCDARHTLLKNITASVGWVKPVLSLPNGLSRPITSFSPQRRKVRKGYTLKTFVRNTFTLNATGIAPLRVQVCNLNPSIYIF